MDNEDPYIGQVIFNTGDDKIDDVWDDSELIAHWEKAKEAYKKRQDQQSKTPLPPFGTKTKNKQRRIEKRTPLKKKITPPPRLPQQTPPPPPAQVNDGLTQMIMAWYYAGYYTGLFLGGSGSGTQ